MANRLSEETSPYLLQHQDNPVDWYPWGPEALERAVTEDRPILLSVGYSACHWCHVMERESFENADIAAVMNEHFVCIKVDREERPDIDSIYMLAVQGFTGGRGGWPMTVFLTPQAKPFFGGTYFPPEPRQGMPSFSQVMARVIELYADDPSGARSLGDRMVENLAEQGHLPPPAEALSQDWLTRVALAADTQFDEEDAGFGGAPKFPPHGTLSVLLAHHATTRDGRSLEMVTRTLDGMSLGGMFDVIGGGFARYSVDARWLVPHFEKMLYDNALLVPVYVDAHRVTQRAGYAAVAHETLRFVMRELSSPDGGFYSALDADSEGEEGKFYAWSRPELVEALGAERAAQAADLLGVTVRGTFERGTSAVRLAATYDELTPAQRALLEEVRPLLHAARAERVRPGRDDKIITAWNALMISAFAKGAMGLGEPVYRDVAVRAAQFVESKLTEDGRLLRTYKDGRARFVAYLDDHAFWTLALIDLHQATQDIAWLERANAVADRTVELFWDDAEGGLFYTGSDGEALITRGKNLLGGALPSGNGAAAYAFARLAALCGRDDLGERADRILRSYQPLLDAAARAIGVEALAAGLRTGAGMEIGVVGDGQAFVAAAHARYLPFAHVAHVDGEGSELLPWMAHKGGDGETAAYLCRNRTCELPTSDLEAWTAQLEQAVAPAKPVTAGRVRAPALPEAPELWLNADGKPDTDGRVLVLDFWTYCCINCLHVLPELAELERRLGDAVSVIGVHSAKFTAEKVRANVARAIERHGVRHPVVLDGDHTIWDAFAVRAWPTVVVVDATGRVAWQKSGEVEADELERVVRRTLAEAEIEVAEPAAGEVATSVEAGLRFPGKVLAWPDAVAQARGMDAYGDEARLYVADSGNHRILELSLSRGDDGWPEVGVRRKFGGEAGFEDGVTPKLRGPQGLSRLDAELWFADTENHALRVLDLETGAVRTAAGTGERGRGKGYDPSRPRAHALRSPWDVVAMDGGVLVAMAGAHQIWVYLTNDQKIGPLIGSGAEAHVDGPSDDAALAQPSGLAAFGKHLFWVDSETSSVRLADLEQHVVATVLGRGLFDFGDVDGDAEQARLQHPLGIAAAQGNEIYVADTFNHKVKVIDLATSSARTLAGGDDDALCEPGGLTVVGDFLIVADTGRHRLVAVRREDGAHRVIPVEV